MQPCGKVKHQARVVATGPLYQLNCLSREYCCSKCDIQISRLEENDMQRLVSEGHSKYERVMRKSHMKASSHDPNFVRAMAIRRSRPYWWPYVLPCVMGLRDRPSPAVWRSLHPSVSVCHGPSTTASVEGFVRNEPLVLGRKRSIRDSHLKCLKYPLNTKTTKV